MHLVIDQDFFEGEHLREEESFLYVFVPANIKVIFLQEHNLPKHRDEAGSGGGGEGACVGDGEQHRVAEIQRVRELCREEGKAGHRQWVDGLIILVSWSIPQ